MKSLLYLVLLFSISGYSQGRRKIRHETDTMCNLTWKFIKLKKPITGRVIFHATARGNCGLMAYASVTLIQTSTNDTVRIIEMCNNDKDFKPQQMVLIKPEKGINTGTVAHDPLYCRLKKTHFGNISAME